MINLLINALSVGLIAKDLLGGKKTESTPQSTGGGLGTFGKIALTAGGWYVATKVYSAYQKKQTEDEAGSNTKDGQASLLAIQIYDAFFPLGTPSIPDGTNETQFRTAIEAAKSQNIVDLVIQKYRTLYNRGLVQDATSEGVLDIYNEVVSGKTTPTTPTTPKKNLSVGMTVYSYGGWNLRGRDNSNVISRKSVAGESFIVSSWKQETIAGQSGIWVIVYKKISNSQQEWFKIFINGLYTK